MKKVLTIFVCLLLAISASACAATDEQSTSSSEQSPATSVSSEASIAQPSISQEDVLAGDPLQPEEPPTIIIRTSDGTSLNYVVGLNMWNGAIFDRESTMQMYAREYTIKDAPYVKLGSKIAIAFESDAPESVKLIDYILDADGNSKYSDKEMREIPITIKDGAGEFELTANPTALLSSNSADYEPGATIRGFILRCYWGESECEYGFVLKSDATPSQSSSSSNVSSAASQPAESYTIVTDQSSYPVDTKTIKVTITNNTTAEGGYGLAYTIEKQNGNQWEKLPLEFAVREIAAVLMPGDSGTETIDLHQEQYDYTPGKYRITMTDAPDGLTVEFTLE